MEVDFNSEDSPAFPMAMLMEAGHLTLHQGELMLLNVYIKCTCVHMIMTLVCVQSVEDYLNI